MWLIYPTCPIVSGACVSIHNQLLKMYSTKAWETQIIPGKLERTCLCVCVCVFVCVCVCVVYVCVCVFINVDTD